jgi:hypothetical protein
LHSYMKIEEWNLLKLFWWGVMGKGEGWRGRSKIYLSTYINVTMYAPCNFYYYMLVKFFLKKIASIAFFSSISHWFIAHVSKVSIQESVVLYCKGYLNCFCWKELTPYLNPNISYKQEKSLVSRSTFCTCCPLLWAIFSYTLESVPKHPFDRNYP